MSEIGNDSSKEEGAKLGKKGMQVAGTDKEDEKN
jgi:hypothetical protein